MNIISAADIIVEHIKQVNKGNLQAFCTVCLPDGMKINSARIIQQPGQRPWVAMPQSEWVDSHGSKRYSPIIELPAELMETISQAVLTAWTTGQRGR